MAVITMPDSAVPNSVTPYLRDFSTILTPFMGGPEQRIIRLGTRFGSRVALPPKDADDALTIQSRLLRARYDRLLMPWYQPGLDTGAPGAPVVSATVASGTTIPLSGVAAGYRIKEGQFASIIHAGRRYLHMFAADVVIPSSGSATISVWPMLRVSLSAGDVVEIAKPMIEGFVNPGEELSWQTAVDHLSAFNFTIAEAA
ncbi:hypothetical protein [Novosphingobium sp. YAF33]|uniref:hypothetical protein n=1 Tax=Novosphingobium sp. YAF33 TaxID=3233082 RepID=UPI003F98E0A5